MMVALVKLSVQTISDDSVCRSARAVCMNGEWVDLDWAYSLCDS